jgi:hypothetical protein
MGRSKKSEQGPVSVTQPDEPAITEDERPGWRAYMAHVGEANFATNVSSCKCYTCRVNRSFFRKIWLPNWRDQGRPIPRTVEENYEHDQGQSNSPAV